MLTVPSGSEITFDTVSHEGLLEDQGRDPVAYFSRYGIAPEQVLKEASAIVSAGFNHDFDKDGPHIVTGPVHVEGASPGDVLKVEVLALEPRVPYGVISNRHYKGALPGEFPEESKRDPDANPLKPDAYGNVSIFTPIEKQDDRWFGLLGSGGETLRCPLSPFVGIMGVAPDVDESWSSVPPSRIGGNIDINELGVGATLYLPVEVQGAKFYVGDPHFAQGDGEVALTALEGSLRATIRLTVLKKGSSAIPKTQSDNLVSPFAETERYWIPIGLDEDLDEAMKMAVRESISFLAKQFGMDRKLVYAYLSAAVDYEVSQVVDKTKGVHGLVPKVDFSEYIVVELTAGDTVLPVLILNNALYVPVEKVCTALNMRLTRQPSGTFSVAAPVGHVGFAVYSHRYIVDGKPAFMELSPMANEGSVLLPVQSLGDILGIAVNWSTDGNAIQRSACVLHRK